MSIKTFIKSIPVLGPLAKALFGKKSHTNDQFPGSANYWENRYAQGGNSGAGSYNRLAEFKAEIINDFVAKNKVQSVIEFGCGDGNQLELANYPKYLGLDVSETILEQCRVRFEKDLSKEFQLSNELTNSDLRSELTMSLDVLFHLIEPTIFENYMRELFATSERFVIIYSSNFDKEQTFHEKDRKFTEWVAQNISEWRLIEEITNRYPFDPEHPNETSKADFFIYEKGQVQA